MNAVRENFGLPLLVALAFLLGFVLHRGSICAVVASRDLVLQRQPGRLLGFAEAALIATMVLTAVSAFPRPMPDWADWPLVLLGASMLGVGAFINGACAFGTIGRIGTGDLGFVSTFAGIFFGGWLARWLYADATIHAVHPAAAPAVTLLPALVLLALVMVLRYRLAGGATSEFLRVSATMAIVGLVYALLDTAIPDWALAHAPRYILALAVFPTAIAAALMIGSIASGLFSGERIRWRWPDRAALFRRAVGGSLMGAGAMLAPGSNDTLLLSGVPSGAPQALVAYVTLFATIAVLVKLQDAARGGGLGRARR